MIVFQPEDQTYNRRDDHPEVIVFCQEETVFLFFYRKRQFFVFYRKRQSFLSFIVRDPVCACL